MSIVDYYNSCDDCNLKRTIKKLTDEIDFLRCKNRVSLIVCDMIKDKEHNPFICDGKASRPFWCPRKGLLNVNNGLG